MSLTYNLNMDWKFIKADVPEAKAVSFDDSSWSNVSLPHTYNDVDTFDNFMEGGHNGERSMFTGKTWYRKFFKLAENQKDKKIYIEFEGVRQAAEVYINGTKLAGKNESGFIAFGYDLTDYVHFGNEENILAVMVDNSFPYYAEGTDAILSWHDSHWHPTHGGIYRNVKLHVKNKLHTTLPLYSYLETQGVYVYNENIEESTADIVVEAEVANDFDQAKTTEIVVTVKDQSDNVVLTFAEVASFEAVTKQVVRLSGNLQNAKRWSPDYPYLYEVEVAVKHQGEIVDTQTVEHGIRTYEFTANQGFFMNGRPMKLTGWGQRPTNEWAGVGAAFPDWMHTHIHELMKEAGGNFIRWGHSAGAPADIRASDRLGLIAVQPGVDGEGSTIGGVYSEESYQIRIKAFRDLIIYFRNSPSIFVWEAGNQSVPENEAIAFQELHRQWDPHGKRPLAYRRMGAETAPYADLSIGTEGSWEMRSKGFAIIEGEYNREEGARRVWDRYTEGYEDYHTTPGSAYDLTSEDLAKNQAKHYKKISNPAHCGGANWIFSDSTSHGRVYSEVSRVSGQVDGVMLPKESYYATRAIFRQDPQLHIIGHWNYPQGTVKDVYVMANCESVELYINDKLVGEGERSDSYLFIFKKINFVEGMIRAVGYDADGQVVISQKKETTGEAHHLVLTPMHGAEGLKADGADYLHIDVEAVDIKGRRVPTFEGKVVFTLDGPAIWRGGYNSGSEGTINKHELYLEAGINRVAIRSTLEAGDIRLFVKSAEIGRAEITVTSKTVSIENGLSQDFSVKEQVPLGEYPGLGEGPVSDQDLVAMEDESAFYFTDFSYSGIHEVGPTTRNLINGDLAFADEEAEFRFLPEFLIEGEALCLPNADRNYKALDLIHVTINKDADVFVAHDINLEKPEWLLEEFEPTNHKMIINNWGHALYKKTVKAGTTLTLGGNLDEASTETGNMYLVFATEVDADQDDDGSFWERKNIDWSQPFVLG
ncbi:sugar-binding domain-containing protein [Jeotgalibaca sp. A127]|uniref:sugar-binding domain-containing protein n=1 Tax=Jeotgalibaca sp. A127 TaxID=3457324 RepID=UPI003FD5A3F7